MTNNDAEKAPRSVRIIAAVATVPILAVCALLTWALPGLDPLGQGRADGAVVWPISMGLATVALLVGVLRAPRYGAGCLLTLLIVLALPCTLYLTAMLSEW